MFCEILITHQTKTEYLPFDFAPLLPHYLRERHVSARKQKKPLNWAHLDSIYPRCIFLLLSRQSARLPPYVHLVAHESLSERAAVPLVTSHVPLFAKTCTKTNKKLCADIFVRGFFFLPTSVDMAVCVQSLPNLYTLTVYSRVQPAVCSDVTY